ncbi:MAG: FtsX-like permease family protein [Lachnospiraceae bacterium]|nr:FtsX-like permease family protein [Lachnospiraceae bacterium]
MILRDFFRSVKRTFSRFISILLMVAIGVAFYTGVRSSEPDMKLTADLFYDDADFFDIRVLSTLGLTEDDLDIIRKTDGVLRAEGGFQTELISFDEDSKKVFFVFSLGDEINKMVLEGGRLPEKAGECFMDRIYFEDNGLKLGDVIELQTDESAEDSIEDILVTEKYTVVGYGTYPWYTTFERGTSSIGDGTTNAYLGIRPEDFVNEDEVYHSIFVSVSGAKEENCYEDAYEDTVDLVLDRIKLLEDERCAVRYDDVVGEGEREIAKAKEKIEDAKLQIADGEKKLADAKTEYDDTVAKAKADIADARKKLASGRKEYNDGLLELEKNKEDLAKAKEELEEARLEIEENEESVLEARAEYEETAAGFSDMEKQVPEISMMLKAGEAQVIEAEEAIKAAKEEWQNGWDEVLRGEEEIEKAEIELEKARKELADGEKKIADGEKELEDGKITFAEETAKAEKDIAEGREKIADGEAEIADGEEKLADIEYPEWYVLKRSESVQSFIEYGQDSKRIGAVGRLFPAIFFLVAALVSLTTMTRMVEEERTQIGTLKALGYRKIVIASKYFLYAIGASLAGGIIGVAVGHVALPYVIINSYRILYQGLPEPVMIIEWGIAIGAVAIAVLCTTLAALVSCYTELSIMPAELMRPAAPKVGKRIFLEYIPFIWRKLTFTWKSTVRNLFRYKKRLFMTMFGIGGCMALLMVGFGLRDSIQTIVDNQYGTIWTYDASLSIDEKKNPSTLFESREEIDDFLRARVVAMDAENAGTKKSVYLMVPERTEGFHDYVKFQDRTTGEVFTISDNGAAVSEKLANMLDLKIGDSFVISSSDTEKVTVKVDLITENYLYYYVYVTKDYYEKVFNEEVLYNQAFLHLTDITDAEKIALSTVLLQDNRVLTYTDVKTLEEKVANMMHSLDLVIWVLIFAAGLLAFVVLYNLNNISILERKRELATLKVLGFYDIEVAEYVYRENILLTIFGVVLGVLLGFVLHRFVILTCEIDMIMFGRSIKPLSYLWSTLLTFLFTVVVNAAMFYRLRKVDMVESLKSAE